jgi:hypothetical protein
MYLHMYYEGFYRYIASQVVIDSCMHASHPLNSNALSLNVMNRGTPNAQGESQTGEICMFSEEVKNVLRMLTK